MGYGKLKQELPDILFLATPVWVGESISGYVSISPYSPIEITGCMSIFRLFPKRRGRVKRLTLPQEASKSQINAVLST